MAADTQHKSPITFDPRALDVYFGGSRIYAWINQGIYPPDRRIDKSCRRVKAKIGSYPSKLVVANNSLSAG